MTHQSREQTPLLDTSIPSSSRSQTPDVLFPPSGTRKQSSPFPYTTITSTTSSACASPQYQQQLHHISHCEQNHPHPHPHEQHHEQHDISGNQSRAELRSIRSSPPCSVNHSPLLAITTDYFYHYRSPITIMEDVTSFLLGKQCKRLYHHPHRYPTRHKMKIVSFTQPETTLGDIFANISQPVNQSA